MKLLLYISFIFFGNELLLSQSIVFNNLYNLPTDTVLATSGLYAGQYIYNDDIISDVVEINDSTFITSGYGNNQWSWSNAPVHYYFRALKINKYGEIINDTIIDPVYGGVELGHTMVADDDYAYMIGYKTDSSNSYLTDNFLLKLDKDFNNYELLNVNYVDSFNLLNGIALKDSSIYISNQYKLDINTLPDFNITKLKKDGTPLDTLIFNSAIGNYGLLLNIYQDTILLFVEDIEVTYYDSYSVIHKINLNNNSIIETSNPIRFMPNADNLIRDLKITNTNEIYVCGWYKDVLGLNRARSAIMKLDIEGNIIWKKFYDLDLNSDDDDSFGSIEESANGDLVLFGLYLNSNSYYEGKLMKIEANTGDIIWERLLQRDTTTYVNSGYSDILYRMKKTSDNGYILNGRANNVELKGDTSSIKRGADAWLLKTDSCGFTEGDFPVPNFVVESIVKYTVTINNTSDNYCTASINYGNGDSSTFYAYSNPRTEEFTYTFADTGTYTIKLTALAGEEFRTYENTIRIYGDTSVGIKEIGLEDFTVSLYPNPAQNIVIIVFNEDLLKNFATIKTKVFNYSGKEVFTSEYNTNIQKQAVDVSTLSNGVYYISFYSEDNLNLGTKKFVVLR